MRKEGELAASSEIQNWYEHVIVDQDIVNNIGTSNDISLRHPLFSEMFFFVLYNERPIPAEVE